METKMKSLREWVEENNLNEIFGLFGKPKAQEPAPVAAAPEQEKAWCPFCNAWSATLDDAYYPHGQWVWHCNKCNRDWDEKIIKRLHDKQLDDYEPGRGSTKIFLPKTDFKGGPMEGVKSTGHLIEMATNKTLYLAGLISEDSYYENEQIQQGQANNTQGQPTDINQIASQLQFQPTSKKKLTYQYAVSTENMPAMSYTVAQQQMPVVTTTADGKETQNTAEPNDIIMSGPSREQYVIKSAKFPKLYQGQIGGPVHPEQGPRNVAVYGGNAPITFTASWGESMVLKPGDYLVKEAEGKFYRIAKQEYEQTYNPPGKVG